MAPGGGIVVADGRVQARSKFGFDHFFDLFVPLSAGDEDIRHVVARRTHCFEVRMTNPDTRFFLGGCEDVREHLNQLLLFHFCAFPACVTLSLAAYRTPKRGDAPSSQKTASTGFPLSTTRRAERSRIAPHVRRVRCPRRQGFPASPAERYSVRKPL